MEQVRLLAAVGLSFLVLFVWSMFFNYNQNPIPNEQIDYIEKNSEIQISQQRGATKINEYTVKETDNFISDLTYEPREITVDTPLFRMILSENGGVIKSTILKNYKEEMNSENKPKEIVSKQLPFGNVSVHLFSDANKINSAIFRADLESNYLEISDNNETINFMWDDGNGKILVKSFIFRPDNYLIDMNIIIKNKSDHVINDKIVLSLNGEIPNKSGYGFEGPSAFINGKLKQFKIKDIKTTGSYDGQIDWIAFEDRYFMYSMIPLFESNENVDLSIKNNVIINSITSEFFQILPNHKIEFQTSLFMGPKSINVLNTVGHNIKKAIYFGIFDFIAKPCLWFMNKIYSVIPNYGIAIIILTIFTKLLLWPLGSKGYKSMSEMKKLQPLMSEIRKKYKNDKQKMNQEIMALYKTYKVNPMGGCLPMLLQIPFFFALYRMLYQAIELRHAPFIFWINDLSAPDRLFNFSFSIPFMQPPYGIPVLTIIMGASMFVQQKMSPPPGDPTQAKMMMFMPIIFTFIFINFSSGLVLYWLTNNILSIIQQSYIQKKTT